MPKSSLQLVDEVVDEGVPEKEPAHDDEEANLQRALELSLKEQGERTQGPARPVVIREPNSGRIQPLPETPKPKNPVDQFIFQIRTPMPTKPSEHADSPSLDAELALTDSETESEEEVSVIKAGDQDEGQAGPNPGEQDEGQAGSNPGDAAESQPQPKQIDEEFTTTAYPNVQENLKLLTEDQMILEEPASSTGTLSSLQNLDKDLSFTDQFFVEKPREEEPGKTNAEAEVQSMVSVPIHQDTSSVPPTTTPVIDLTKSQSDSLLPTSTATTSIITTTTLSPPPLQSTTDPILVRRIGELEQHIANLIQNNLALEERLDKHGSRLYKLENLNIPHQVSKAVDEIVTDAVDWAMQAPLRARFRDLPTVDMKEILQQRMFEDNTYKTHEVHNDLYEALQKTPPGSLPTQPPPPAGASGAPGSQAPSSSKTAASASQSMAWTTSDTQYESADIPGAQELSPTDYLMQDDSIPEEQVLLSDDEDSENDHQPKADLRKDWWKPLPEEERPATPEPAWTIPSSNKSDVVNN
ncbi:retrovirus-related pol polyprotein from transposon TNT 1-94 [Tanacetum coccineum]